MHHFFPHPLICRAFGERFPSKMAILQIGDAVYDDFGHQPFAIGPPNLPCTVTFLPTDNPHFYDVADRGNNKEPSLAEAMQASAPRPLPVLSDLPKFV